jgi:DnaJ domain
VIRPVTRPVTRAVSSRGAAQRPVQDPFEILGLERSADLSDDEVHAAWRRTASATHPDREDGGDPARFADAAAAYTALRTRFGRGEALADLRAGPTAGLGGRVMRGRPGRLALRILVAGATGAAAVAAAGPHPAAPALVTGVATWLVLTARHDLAPPVRPRARRGRWH